MKKNSAFKTFFIGVAVLAIVTLFSSCEKNVVDESGFVNLKMVNAAPNSGAQSFYLANKPIVTGGLGFTDASDYIVTNSGNWLEAQFRNEGTPTAYATGDFWLEKGTYYTIYVAGEGETARVKTYKDDLSAPPSGKAKVKFIHLSDAAPAKIDIKNSAGETLAGNLSRNDESKYVGIAPGSLSLQLYNDDQTSNIGNFELTNFAEGKIYTIYVTGAFITTLSVHKIQHN